MIQREWLIQTAVVRWVRACVDAPHLFLSFDSAKKASIAARQREKARGVAAGTPDCALFVAGFAPVFCELKAPGNKPSASQEAMGDQLMRVGCFWSWCDGVEKYALWLKAIGIPLSGNALLAAQDADLKVAGWVAKKEGVGARSYRPARKPARGVAKLNAARAAGLI